MLGMLQVANEDGASRTTPKMPRRQPASNVLHRHWHGPRADLADVAVCTVVQSGEEFWPRIWGLFGPTPLARRCAEVRWQKCKIRPILHSA